MKTVIGLVAAVVALLVAACFVLDRLNRPQREQLTPGKKGILCIGDSITFGTGVMFSRKKNCWVYKLSERLPGWQALDYGCPGATCVDTGDKPYRQQHLLDAAQDSGAELAIIMLGTNDSKAQNWDAAGYRNALKRLVSEVAGWSSVRHVILMTPPEAFRKKGKDTSVYGIRGEIIGGEVYPIVLQTAQECGVSCIDLYSFTKDHPEYFGDGVHPNALGNEAIAEFVAGQAAAML